MIRGKPDSQRGRKSNPKDVSKEIKMSRKQRFEAGNKDLIKNLAEQIEQQDYSQLGSLMKFWGSRVSRYSRRNTFGLFLQNPNMEHPVTLREMKKHGHKLKEGGQVYEILRPIFLKLDADGNVIRNPKKAKPKSEEKPEAAVQVDEEEEEEEEKEVEVASTKKIFWPVNCVVDLGNDTEGPPLSHGMTAGENTESLCEAMKAFAESRGVTVKTMAGKGALMPGALGVSDGKGTIGVYSGMSKENQFSVMVHEMAHEIIHDMKSRENEEYDHKTRELHAEGVAFLVCSYFGIAGEGSALYLKSYQVTAEDLEEHFDIISKTAREITYNIEKQLKLQEDVETEIDNSKSEVIEDVESLDLAEIDEIAGCIKF
jgi:hypothetical protein